MSKFLKFLLATAILALAVVFLTGIVVPDEPTNRPLTESERIQSANAADKLVNTLISNSSDGTQHVPEFPYPVHRLAREIYVDCPATLEVFDSSTNSWQPAAYIEPEFTVPPENVLWVVEPTHSYRIVVDFGSRLAYLGYHEAAQPSYNTSVVYSSNLQPGALGTFCVELGEHFGEVGGVCVVYCGEVKFITDDGAQLYATSPTMDTQGYFSIDFCPRSADQEVYQDFKIDSPFDPQLQVSSVVDCNHYTVYSTNLANYLYPRGVPEELKWYFDQFPITEDAPLTPVPLATD